MVMDWTAGKNKRLSFLQNTRPALGTALPLIQWVTLIPSRRVKRPGREANLSLPCKAFRAVATAIGSHNYETEVAESAGGVWVDSNALWQLGVPPCSLAAVHQRLRETCCLLQHGTSIHTASFIDPNKERNMCLWHNDEPGPDCTVLHIGSQQWSQLPLGNPKFHLHDEDTFLYFSICCCLWSKKRTLDVKNHVRPPVRPLALLSVA